MSKLKEEEELFSSAGDAKLHNFAEMTKIENSSSKEIIEQYAVVSFWQKTETGSQEALQPYLVPFPLGMCINNKNDLREVVFSAENLKLAFMFCLKAPINNAIKLVFLGEPEVQMNVVDGKPTKEKPSTIRGVHYFDICEGSHLERAVHSYMDNSKK